MDDQTNRTRPRDPRLTRRRLMRLTVGAAALALGGALGACSPAAPTQAPPQPTKPAAPAASATQGAPAPGSAPAQTPTAAAAAPAAGKTPVDLLLLQLNRPPWIDLFNEYATAYKAKNPNVSIKVEAIPDNFASVVLARVAAGTAGDICANSSHFTLPARAHQGMFRPIDAFVAADKYDVKQHLDVAVRACTVGGKLITLPWGAHTGWSGIYYVKDLFDQAGLAHPTDKWTYDDVTAAAQKLTKSSGGQTEQWGLWVNANYETTVALAVGWGGGPQNEDGTKPTWTEPKTAASLQFRHDVYHKWKVSPANPDPQTRLTLWSSKKVAMVLDGLFDNAALTNAAPAGIKWGVIGAPVGPGGKRGGAVSVDNYPMWRTTRNPEQAWEFTKFVSTKEAGLRAAEFIGVVGGRSDVWNDPKIQENPLLRPHADVINSLPNMPIPANGRQEEVWSMVTTASALMWSGEQSVAAGAAELQRKAEQIFAQPAPGA